MNIFSRIKRRLQFSARQRKTIRAWKNADYYIMSFPKSGRTWLRLLLATYYSEAYKTPVGDRFNAFQTIHPNIPRLFFEHRGFDTGIINKSAKGTVSLEKVSENIERLHGKNIVFIARDPRDVVISHYFSATKRSKSKTLEKKLSGVTLSDFIRKEGFGIEHIITYMNMWYEAQTQFPQFHIIRYEDMKKTIKPSVSKLLSFLGEPVINTDALSKAIERADFNNMKKLEKKGVKDTRLQPGDATDPESFKVRRGKVGGFQDYLSDDDILYVHDALKQLHPGFGYTTAFETNTA